MKIIDNRIVTGFNTREQAETILNRLLDIAEDYHYVSVADLKDLCAIESHYLDNHLRWSESAVRGAEILRDFDGNWKIRLTIPGDDRPTIKKAVYKSSYKSTPEPLNITINTNEIDDFDNVLVGVFRQVYTITDRAVFINIT